MRIFLSLIAYIIIASCAKAPPSGEEGSWTASYCKNSGALCGVIVYANSGAYVVNPVKVWAKSSQPAGDLTNPNCPAINAAISGDVDVGQYDTFEVPADCAYELKIEIRLANDKSRDLFLTPGCQIVAETDGTTVSNNWSSVKATWINGDPGTPTDSAGNKCGMLGDM